MARLHETGQLPRAAWSYDEVARMLGKHRSWVYRKVAAGKIRPVTGYGTAMISAGELQRVLGTSAATVEGGQEA